MIRRQAKLLNWWVVLTCGMYMAALASCQSSRNTHETLQVFSTQTMIPFSTPALTPTAFPTEWKRPIFYDLDFIFSDEICTLPCWKGIMPGETRLEELIKLLPGGTHFPTSPWSIYDNISEYTFINPEGYYVDVILFDNIVETIGFDVYSTGLWMIIEVLGEPDFVVSPGFVPESGSDAINIFYLDKGIRGEAEGVESHVANTVQVHPNMRVYVITLHEPIETEDFNEVLDKWYWRDYYLLRKYHDVLPWQGFGDYGIGE